MSWHVYKDYRQRCLIWTDPWTTVLGIIWRKRNKSIRIGPLLVRFTRIPGLKMVQWGDNFKHKGSYLEHRVHMYWGKKPERNFQLVSDRHAGYTYQQLADKYHMTPCNARMLCLKYYYYFRRRWINRRIPLINRRAFK